MREVAFDAVGVQGGAVDAVGQVADARPHRGVGDRVDLLRERLEVRLAEVGEELLGAAAAYGVGGGLCLQVAPYLVREAYVRQQQVLDALLDPAGPEQAQRGDQDALGDQLGRAQRGCAADVRGVGHGAGERDEPSVVEDRGDHGDVGQVPGRGPRVVGDDAVALAPLVRREPVEDECREGAHQGGEGGDAGA